MTEGNNRSDETLPPAAEAPTEFASADDPAAPKPIRTVTLVQYEDNAFGIKAVDAEGRNLIQHDLPALKGTLEYALHWLGQQWELGDMQAKFDLQVRLMDAQQQKVQVAPPLGSAGRFFGGKRH